MYQQRAPAPILESNTSKRAVIDVSHDDDDDWLPVNIFYHNHYKILLNYINYIQN